MQTTATVATMNFVVYIGDDEHREIILDRAEAVAAARPARLILLDDTKEGALCAPSSFHAGRFTAAALLRNIPTVLWWASRDAISQTFFSEIVDCVHEVVVDSSRYFERGDAIEDLVAFHARFGHVAIRDLAWLRGHIWRDTIAELFDNPAAMHELQTLRRVDISGGSPPEAQYLIGWLASRLGWVHERSMHFRTRDDRMLKFTHIDAQEAGPLREIRLASALANFRIALEDDGATIGCFSQIDGLPISRYHLPFHQADDAQLIEQAVPHRGTDELFEASLRSLRETRP